MYIKDWKKEVFTIPNMLSLFRLLLIPVYVVIYLNATEAHEYFLAGSILAVSCLTDMIDGKIARKYNLITDFGKFMDPLADKFLVFSAILVFVSSSTFNTDDALHIALVISGAVVIFRELAVTSLRLVVMSSPTPVVIAARSFGVLSSVAD